MGLVEIRSTDIKLTAQRLVEPETTSTTVTESLSSEERELAELRSKVEFGKYVGAALAGMPVMGGPELEYNQHLRIAANYFPLELLAGPGEHRTLRNCWQPEKAGQCQTREIRGRIEVS